MQFRCARMPCQFQCAGMDTRSREWKSVEPVSPNASATCVWMVTAQGTVCETGFMSDVSLRTLAVVLLLSYAYTRSATVETDFL